MDWQIAFYITGTIFMLLGIVILVATIYFLWRVERNILDFRKNMLQKCSCFFHEHKKGLVGLCGVGISTFIVNRIKNYFKKDNE